VAAAVAASVEINLIVRHAPLDLPFAL